MQKRGSSPTNRGPRAGIPRGVVERDGFTSFDLELNQRVARRQIDSVAFARVPATDNQTARVRVRFDLVNQSRDLIEAIALRIMAAERSPEITIDRAEIAGFATKTAGVLFISP